MENTTPNGVRILQTIPNFPLLKGLIINTLDTKLIMRLTKIINPNFEVNVFSKNSLVKKDSNDNSPNPSVPILNKQFPRVPISAIVNISIQMFTVLRSPTMIIVGSLWIKVLTINGEMICVIRFMTRSIEGLTNLKPVADIKLHVPEWVSWLVKRPCDTVYSES